MSGRGLPGDPKALTGNHWNQDDGERQPEGGEGGTQ